MRQSPNPVDGRKIARLRDRAGHTSSSFAAIVGVSVAHMARIERNQRGPSPAVRNRILDALGVDLDAVTPDPAQISTAA